MAKSIDEILKDIEDKKRIKKEKALLLEKEQYNKYLKQKQEWEHRNQQMFYAAGGIKTNPSFISTWRTTSNDESVTLPYVSSGQYRGYIDWGDGTVTTNIFDNRTHTYAVAGNYVITISGYMRGWAFNNTGDRLKLRSIQQWGCFNNGNLSGAFHGCTDLNCMDILDVPNFNDCTNLNSFFRGCTSITLINGVENWDVSNVNIFSSFFSGVTNFNQDIGNWNVSKATFLNNMFNGATNFNQDIGNWNTPLNTSINGMFNGATNFNQDIGRWDVSNVTNMGLCFLSALNFNQDIGNWNVSNVTIMNNMFDGITLFNQDIGNWNVSNVTNMGNFMRTKTTLTFSATNLDAIYNGWSTRPVQPNITITFGTAKRTAASTSARAILTEAPNNWTITDGGI